MKKRVYIIHGWEGNPQAGWFPWLKKELENKGFNVHTPQMPNPDEPQLDEWFNKMKEIVIEPDEQTFFVGHSLGCITISRYLESLSSNTKVGGAVFVAGFPEAIGYDELKTFFSTPLDYEKVRVKANSFVAINSDNDPYVDLENGEILRDKLGAKLIIEKGMKHFSGDEGIVELPVVLDSILDICK